jgi:hypothetical protein
MHRTGEMAEKNSSRVWGLISHRFQLRQITAAQEVTHVVTCFLDTGLNCEAHPFLSRYVRNIFSNIQGS